MGHRSLEVPRQALGGSCTLRRSDALRSQASWQVLHCKQWTLVGAA